MLQDYDKWMVYHKFNVMHSDEAGAKHNNAYSTEIKLIINSIFFLLVFLHPRQICIRIAFKARLINIHRYSFLGKLKLIERFSFDGNSYLI